MKNCFKGRVSLSSAASVRSFSTAAAYGKLYRPLSIWLASRTPLHPSTAALEWYDLWWILMLSCALKVESYCGHVASFVWIYINIYIINIDTLPDVKRNKYFPFRLRSYFGLKKASWGFCKYFLGWPKFCISTVNSWQSAFCPVREKESCFFHVLDTVHTCVNVCNSSELLFTVRTGQGEATRLCGGTRGCRVFCCSSVLPAFQNWECIFIYFKWNCASKGFLYLRWEENTTRNGGFGWHLSSGGCLAICRIAVSRSTWLQPRERREFFDFFFLPSNSLGGPVISLFN